MALRKDLVELRSVSGTEENISGVEIEFRGDGGGRIVGMKKPQPGMAGA